MADQVSVEIEVQIIDCAECLVPIKTLWLKNRGLLPGDYVLIADWVFHPDCWEKKAALLDTSDG